MHIDTLSIARDLKAADLPPAQAEAIATAIGQALREGVATKGDVEALKGDFDSLAQQISGLDRRLDGVREQGRNDLKAAVETLRAEMKALEQTLRAEIERSRNQILVWIIGAQVALSGLTIALVKL